MSNFGSFDQPHKKIQWGRLYKQIVVTSYGSEHARLFIGVLCSRGEIETVFDVNIRALSSGYASKMRADHRARLQPRVTHPRTQSGPSRMHPYATAFAPDEQIGAPEPNREN